MSLRCANPSLPTPAVASPPPSAAAGSPYLPIGPARFVGASLMTTLMSLALLAGLIHSGVEPVAANLVATSVGAAASYWLNRHWVWDRRGGGVSTGELAAFWGLALAGLALSTAAVSLADSWAEAVQAGPGVQTAASVGANWLAFLSLAALKYVMSRRLYRLAA